MSVLAGPITQGSSKLIMSKQDYVTGMETCEFTYECIIKNVRECIDDGIESPNFSSNFSDFEDKWIFKIYNRNHDLHDQNYFYKTVDLQLQSYNNTSQLQIAIQMSINNRNPETERYDFGKFLQKIAWNRYLLGLELFEPICGHLQNELKICCTITMSKKLMNNSDKISTFVGTRQLTADLKELLLNEQFPDVTIQVGQKSFRAIKSILAVRSPVFSAMFNHEQLKENQSNEVVIEDIDENVFEEFLHFIYTGESPNVDKIPMELLAVADKYQVNCLKNICEEIICGIINIGNVASTLVFSDRYNLKELNKKCLEFMKNNLRAVMSNETFQACKEKHPEIFVSVLEELLSSAKLVIYV